VTRKLRGLSSGSIFALFTVHEFVVLILACMEDGVSLSESCSCVYHDSDGPIFNLKFNALASASCRQPLQASVAIQKESMINQGATVSPPQDRYGMFSVPSQYH
jgi:hypothetical protein